MSRQGAWAAVLFLVAGANALATGLGTISVTDSGIRIGLDAGVSGNVRIVEIEPYDTLNPLRNLVEAQPDSQQLDLSNEGFLRMTFLNGSPFDPQIRFPDQPANMDFVEQLSLRVRATGTAGGANMPIRVFGLPDYVDFSLPADGAWHILRADVSAWSGMRMLRIDPANGQGYADNASAVLDIDWVAVTYKEGFSGGRNHTGWDVFIDLGVPESSWSGLAQPEVALPRYAGVRDRLFSKYLLLEAASTNQIGSARYVTDLSGLSYQTDTTDGWASRGADKGLSALSASNGILVADFVAPTGVWDPGMQVDPAARVDMDVAKEFAVKYRIRDYRGSRGKAPFALFGFVQGESGWARSDDWLATDGEWHVYRTTLDQSSASLSWHGLVQLRLDLPNDYPVDYPPADFSGTVLELNWMAVTGDPLFTPAQPVGAGGRCWTFSKDRTNPLLVPDGIKGLSGPVNADIVDLGCQSEKPNLLQSSTMDLGLNPSVIWPVDEFNVGINQGYLNALGGTMKYFSDNGVVTYEVLLNSLQDYWLDEGTADQRFNPLRNYLTVTNPPNTFSVAHNVMDPLGLAYYRGALEALASTFSDPGGEKGQIRGFIIGNELDAHYAWYNLGDIELEKVVDIYLTSCRMADLALRKYNPDFRVFVSFTHFWNKAHSTNALQAGKPREFLNLFAAKAEAEGDFPWGVCIHPYPVNLFNPEFWNDAAPTDDFSTEYITFKNLQVIRRYLQQAALLYNGQVRPIILGEQGFHVPVDGDPDDEAIQAAALAYSFKITEQVPGVEAYLYHRQLDHSLEGTLRFGLGVDADGLAPWAYARYRPSWQVMHDYGTASEAATFAPYLSRLPIGAWSEINLADIQLRYEFSEPDPDIQTANMAASQTANGVFSGTVAAADPQIFNLNVNTFGDGQETAILRLKTEKPGNWQLFWGRDGGGFTAAQSVTFPVAASADFQLYSFDLSADPDWVGQNITRWRLDPVGSATSYDFEIDYLLFGPRGDFDSDGIPDSVETLADLDSDGLPNLADPDSNGDGLSDSREKRLGLDPLSFDSDSDGIPSDWERAFGANPYETTDAGMDVDYDGYSYLGEYIAVTDPTNAASFFQILEGGVSNDVATVYVGAAAGRTYTLLRSTNLVSGTWQPVDVVVPPVDGTLGLVDTNAPAAGMYKIKVEE